MEKERYENLMYMKYIASGEEKDIDDVIDLYQGWVDTFKQWKDMGVKVDLEASDISGSWIMFYTEDPKTAELLGFEKPELWDEEEGCDDPDCKACNGHDCSDGEGSE